MSADETLFTVDSAGGFASLLNGVYFGRQGSSDGADRTKPLLLIRSGPWVPIVCLPFGGSAIVLDDRGRKLWEELKINHYTFQPVIKKKIVPVSMEFWRADYDGDWSVEGQEAGAFLMESSGSETVADLIGNFWELVLPCGAYFRFKRRKGGREIEVTNVMGWPVFYGFNPDTGAMRVFVTTSGRGLLEYLDGFDGMSSRCLEFSEVRIVP